MGGKMFFKINNKNEEQLEIFNKIWIECWKEKGYELEFTETADRFIIQDDKGNNFGTVEFIKYINGQNNCEQVFNFNAIPEIIQFSDQVIEIDKISILKNYRGKNIERLFYSIYNYSIEHNIKYGIGLIEPLFYKTLKLFYKFPIFKLSKQVFYKGDWVIPIIFKFEYFNKDKESYTWIKSLEKDLHKIN
jgi:hypothetical protein